MIQPGIVRTCGAVILLALLQSAQANIINMDEQQSFNSNRNDSAGRVVHEYRLHDAGHPRLTGHRSGIKSGHESGYDMQEITQENTLVQTRLSEWCNTGAGCENSRHNASDVINEHIKRYASQALPRGQRAHRDSDDDYRHHANEYCDTNTYVPIPAVVWLFGSGLVLLGAIGLRRNNDIYRCNTATA